MNNLELFIKGYVVCALWSSTDYSGNPLDADGRGEDALSDKLRETMGNDCDDFMSSNMPDLLLYAAQYKPKGDFSPWECAGHDFWLTRNGHGAGFWDRGLGELGDRLTKASKTYGGMDLYLDDDGKVHA